MQPELANELIVFDIETKRIPDLGKLLGVDEKIKRLEGMDVENLRRIALYNDITVSSTWKDVEKIRAKVKKGFNDMVDKAALKQWGAQIVSIAAKPLRGVRHSLDFLESGQSISEEPGYEPPEVWYVTDKHNERSIITAFFSYLESFGQAPILGGFNVRGTAPGRKGFDVPMLRVRCALLRIPWPEWLPSTMSHDRNSKMLFDVLDVFKEGSCNQWLKVAGLPTKSASGGDVQNMTPEQISVYNAGDVELERLLIGLVVGTQPAYLQELAEDHAHV